MLAGPDHCATADLALRCRSPLQRTTSHCWATQYPKKPRNSDWARMIYGKLSSSRVMRRIHLRLLDHSREPVLPLRLPDCRPCLRHHCHHGGTTTTRVEAFVGPSYPSSTLPANRARATEPMSAAVFPARSRSSSDPPSCQCRVACAKGDRADRHSAAPIRGSRSPHLAESPAASSHQARDAVPSSTIARAALETRRPLAPQAHG